MIGYFYHQLGHFDRIFWSPESCNINWWQYSGTSVDQTPKRPMKIARGVFQLWRSHNLTEQTTKKAPNIHDIWVIVVRGILVRYCGSRHSSSTAFALRLKLVSLFRKEISIYICSLNNIYIYICSALENNFRILSQSSDMLSFLSFVLISCLDSVEKTSMVTHKAPNRIFFARQTRVKKTRCY